MRENRRNDEIRRRLIAKRQESLAESQASASAEVERLGGKVVGGTWIINSLVIEIEKSALAELLVEAPIYGAFLAQPGLTTGALSDADGFDRQLAFHPLGIAETGQVGASTTNNMKLGIIEAATHPNGSLNLINYLHVGFQDPGNNRIKIVKDCGTTNCAGGWVGNARTHGTTVTSVATGSIQEGQDPAYTTTTAQKERSGLVRESEIGYYRGNTVSVMVQEAYADGMDVANMSVQRYLTQSGAVVCSTLCNVMFDNQQRLALNQVTEMGMALVACAGNQGVACSGQCQTTMPGASYDVVSVAALSDTKGYTGLAKSAWEWVNPDFYSPIGHISKTLFGGATPVMVPTVGLISFGTVRSHFTDNTNGYQTGVPSTIDIGTSIASPQVASLAVAFRQWAETNSITLNNLAWFTNINVLAMGDGRCGAGIPSGVPGAACSAIVDSKYGYGFPRYFTPHILGTYGGWGTRNQVIVQGQTISWRVGGAGNESANVLGWKFALAVDVKSDFTEVSNVTNLPDLNVRVVDVNTGTVIRTATRQGSRYMMQIRNPADIQGKDLEVRVTGTFVRSGGETLWATDYFFSNFTSFHLYVQ